MIPVPSRRTRRRSPLSYTVTYWSVSGCGFAGNGVGLGSPWRRIAGGADAHALRTGGVRSGGGGHERGAHLSLILEARRLVDLDGRRQLRVMDRRVELDPVRRPDQLRRGRQVAAHRDARLGGEEVVVLAELIVRERIRRRHQAPGPEVDRRRRAARAQGRRALAADPVGVPSVRDDRQEVRRDLRALAELDDLPGAGPRAARGVLAPRRRSPTPKRRARSRTWRARPTPTRPELLCLRFIGTSVAVTDGKMGCAPRRSPPRGGGHAVACRCESRRPPPRASSTAPSTNGASGTSGPWSG